MGVSTVVPAVCNGWGPAAGSSNPRSQPQALGPVLSEFDENVIPKVKVKEGTLEAKGLKREIGACSNLNSLKNCKILIPIFVPSLFLKGTFINDGRRHLDAVF